MCIRDSSQTSRKVESSGGTTEEITMPCTELTSSPCIANKLRKRTPYSSTICVLMVETHQCASRRPAPCSADLASKAPSTVLVLPTSMTSSMDYCPPSARTSPESTVRRPDSVRTSRKPRSSSPSVTPSYPPPPSTRTDRERAYEERSSNLRRMEERAAGPPCVSLRYSLSRDFSRAAASSTRDQVRPLSMRSDVAIGSNSPANDAWFTLIPMPTTT